jgi:hypothetical protein
VEKRVSVDFLNVSFAGLANLLAAAGGFGAAAYGLVDVSKAFGGGISNVGFGHVRDTLGFFEPALRGLGKISPLDIFRANWLNGVPQADQKAVVKSIIRLGLSPTNASALAQTVGIDPDALTSAANKIDAGSSLEPEDVSILARFDAIVDAALDGGFERADQQYRNSAKATAAITSTILAVVAGGVAHAQSGGFELGEFIFSQDFLMSLLTGSLATPLAPVAKDLSSSLAGAVRSMSAVRT